MTVRTATQADLATIQGIITKALPADYQWKYCFPARSSVKHDSGVYVQRALEQTLAPGNTDWLVCVAEDPSSRKPVGVAVWSWTDARIQEHVDDNAASQGLTGRRVHNVPSHRPVERLHFRSHSRNCCRRGQRLGLRKKLR